RDAVVGVWHRVHPSPAAPAPAPTPPAGEPSPVGIAVETRVATRVAFETTQRGGEIRVRLDSAARKISVSATRSVPYAVRSGAVVIANANSDASYDVVIPAAGTAVVTVLVAGRPVLEKDGARVSIRAGAVRGDTWVIPFSAIAPDRVR